MENTKKIQPKPFSWTVTHYDCNRNVICKYDVLKYRENDIKTLKKKCKTKAEFADKLKQELMWRYWSKAEWELIIETTDDNRIWLSPWCGCRNPGQVKIDVTESKDFDWKTIAKDYIHYGNEAKIDVWDQIEFCFDKFITYCWEYRHKWQRNKKRMVYENS